MVDSLTSIDNNRKYFGITFHFITPEFEMIHGNRDGKSPKFTNSGNSSGKTQWSLQTNLVCGTTDQGANIKKATHLFSRHITIEWIPCSAHKIQLCINKAMSKTPAAKVLFDKCQKISTLFKNSGAAMKLLNKE
ncbi:hypothetical protein BGZ65_008401 [Modicella reniformis]|uniref:DUF659 domain-containing protein n=1 Tax=Modicella reniformis TaxID=1440133 RepID=A0A9P6IUI4_9FUNG|nr:hypothetical protein BGZ65_008401 [Modicella reniformis]